MVTGLSIVNDGGHIAQRPRFFFNRLGDERASLCRRERGAARPTHAQMDQEQLGQERMTQMMVPAGPRAGFIMMALPG